MEINFNIWNRAVFWFICTSQYIHGSAYIILRHGLPFDSLSVGKTQCQEMIKRHNVDYEKHETEESSSSSLHEDSEM